MVMLVSSGPLEIVEIGYAQLESVRDGSVGSCLLAVFIIGTDRYTKTVSKVRLFAILGVHRRHFPTL